MLLMQIFQCIFNALAVTGNLNQQGAEEDILQLVGITGNNAYVNIKMFYHAGNNRLAGTVTDEGDTYKQLAAFCIGIA